MLDALSSSKNPPDPVKWYGLHGGFKVKCHNFYRLFYNHWTTLFLFAGLLHAWATRRTLKEFNPDLVYSRLTILELAFVPSQIPIVFEMHSLGALGQRWWQRAAFLWIVKIKNFRRIIVTTNALAEWLQKEFPNIEIVIARLSAEPPINLSAKKLEAFKQESLQGNFTRNIGYTGFLDTEGLRGTDIICQMAASMPDIGVHIVGGEPEIVTHWQTYAKQWNKHGNIFFYGYRNPSEMPYFLNIFDVVLAPLQFRPNKRAPLGQNMSPLKLPQYMGYAKAIVASDLNSHREVLKHGETAFLVPHDDVNQWITATRSFLDSENKRKEFGSRAFDAYTAEFKPEQRIKKILKGL